MIFPQRIYVRSVRDIRSLDGSTILSGVLRPEIASSCSFVACATCVRTVRKTANAAFACVAIDAN